MVVCYTDKAEKAQRPGSKEPKQRSTQQRTAARSTVVVSLSMHVRASRCNTSGVGHGTSSANPRQPAREGLHGKERTRIHIGTATPRNHGLQHEEQSTTHAEDRQLAGCFWPCVLHGESNTGQASPRTPTQRTFQPQEAEQPQRNQTVLQPETPAQKANYSYRFSSGHVHTVPGSCMWHARLTCT